MVVDQRCAARKPLTTILSFLPDAAGPNAPEPDTAEANETLALGYRAQHLRHKVDREEEDGG